MNDKTYLEKKLYLSSVTIAIHRMTITLRPHAYYNFAVRSLVSELRLNKLCPAPQSGELG